MLTNQYTPFPWQIKNWRMLQSTYRVGKIAHALLFTGIAGIGLKHFIQCFTQSLLCESSDEDQLQACGICHACKLCQSANHPDILIIKPEETGKQIKVAEIMRLTHFIHLKSHIGSYKIVVIFHADLMNRHAANALLKTLEEPPPQSVLILASNRKNILPITIKSRCQQIHFSPAFDQETLHWTETFIPEKEDAQQLLSAVDGAPLKIQYFLENDIPAKKNNVLEDILNNNNNPIEIAEKWGDYGIQQVLLWLLQLLIDMIRIKSLNQPIKIYTPEKTFILKNLIKKLEFSDLLGFYDVLYATYSLSSVANNYDSKGLLEDVIIAWQQLTYATNFKN